LDKQHFRVFEDGVEQTLAVFRSEDVPVTVGLVLDNSGSMTENRSPMMAGALRFTAFSNPLDEMFVVNFNDDYYLDLEGRDFTNDVDQLRDALDKTDTRGGTAFFDAVRASLAHLKRGTRQKKALVIISDGVDTTSLSDYNTLLRHVQQEEAALYLIQLPCSPDVERRNCRRAKREIKKLAQATGGMAFFPEGVEEVEALCEKVARDIRNQYVLGYYPTNKTRDGSFRQVRIEINAPRGFKGLQARHRPGYYATSDEAAGSQ
ncbi:MAG: VWA domain-containing protein, partial [Terriglobia bacterium]